MNGLSVLLAFGKPCWPKIQFFTRSVRIVFGPMAIYLSGLDLDALFVKMSQMLPEPKGRSEEDSKGG